MPEFFNCRQYEGGHFKRMLFTLNTDYIIELRDDGTKGPGIVAMTNGEHSIEREDFDALKMFLQPHENEAP